MRSVKLNKHELLSIVIDNKQKHIDQYKEAVSDYVLVVDKITAENRILGQSYDLDQISKIKSIPSAPISYEAAYTKAIRMLELSVEEELTIDDTTFNQLVLDEWSWKNNFSLSGSLYKSML